MLHHDMTVPPAPRTETDSFGPIEVAGGALWGAQTERSLRFFAIGEQRMPSAIVHALGQIKFAAAEVNFDLGQLEATKAASMVTAATRIAAGEFENQFPLSMWQTVSGTQSNMNVNEVVANLASLALGGGLGADRRVHPNDDVNLGQSSNDMFPTAMHIAAVLCARPLLASLASLRTALRAKAQQFSRVLKVGRTTCRTPPRSPSVKSSAPTRPSSRLPKRRSSGGFPMSTRWPSVAPPSVPGSPHTP